MSHETYEVSRLEGNILLDKYACKIKQCRQNPSILHITLGQDAELVMSEFLVGNGIIGDICSYTVHFGHAIFYINGDKEDINPHMLSNIPFDERVCIINPRKEDLIFTCMVCGLKK